MLNITLRYDPDDDTDTPGEHQVHVDGIYKFDSSDYWYDPETDAPTNIEVFDRILITDIEHDHPHFRASGIALNVGRGRFDYVEFVREKHINNKKPVGDIGYYLRGKRFISNSLQRYATASNDDLLRWLEKQRANLKPEFNGEARRMKNLLEVILARENLKWAKSP